MMESQSLRHMAKARPARWSVQCQATAFLPDCELRGSPDLLNQEQVACSIQASLLHLKLMHLLILRATIGIIFVVSAMWLQSQAMMFFANAGAFSLDTVPKCLVQDFRPNSESHNG